MERVVPRTSIDSQPAASESPTTSRKAMRRRCSASWARPGCRDTTLARRFPSLSTAPYLPRLDAADHRATDHRSRERLGLDRGDHHLSGLAERFQERFPPLAVELRKHVVE